MKNVIIIGLGNMGLAHLNSFLKNPAKIRYFLVEKNHSNFIKISNLLKKKLIVRFQKKFQKKIHSMLEL